MKYLKPSRLRKAFLKTVSFSAAVAFNSEACMMAVVVVAREPWQWRGRTRKLFKRMGSFVLPAAFTSIMFQKFRRPQQPFSTETEKKGREERMEDKTPAIYSLSKFSDRGQRLQRLGPWWAGPSRASWLASTQKEGLR